MTLRQTVFLIIPMALFCACSAAAADDGKPATDAHAAAPMNDNQALASQANNPTSPLTQLQLRNITGWDIPGVTDRGNLTQLEAVLPFKPFGWVRTPTIMRFTLPYGSLSGPDGGSEFGSVQFFGQAIYKQSWGSLAAGITLSLPSAYQRRQGQTWEAGPAAGFMITKFDNLVIGALLQNPIAVSPSGGESASSSLEVSPTLTYNLPDGWFIGMSDFSWNFDWKDGETTLPLGLQAGRVFRIGGRAFSLSIEGGRVPGASESNPFPKTLIGIEFTSLHPAL